LSVVISVKFAQHVITVKQAIEELLVKSGYDLDSNYESEKINNFSDNSYCYFHFCNYA
jgi:hypothetical protein